MTYNNMGLVNGISTTNPVTAAPMDFVFSYDDAGRRTGLSYPNGVTATYVYDEAGRIESIEYKDASLQVIERVGYAYNSAGERISLDRMNIDPLPPAITNSTYPALPHANRMDTFNGETVVYDDNGNMTQKGTMTLTWDRLVGLSGSQSASFAYDAFGRRIEKTVAGVTTTYLYDGLDIVKEKDGTGATKVWYVRTLNIDEPLARIEADGTVRYYHADALGSIIALTDETGTIRTQYNYSPYGETVVIGEASDNSFQYTGRESDGTGLYFYRNRYYSFEMKSFISEDPIGFAGGMNWYSYVGNRPVNAVDPLGLEEAYHQSSGLTIGTDDFTHQVYMLEIGYSGEWSCGGQNNPDSQEAKDCGPIPRGDWLIGEARNRLTTGKHSVPLSPWPSNDIFESNREPNTFYSHGENPRTYGNSSQGCPVYHPEARKKLREGEIFRVYEFFDLR
jgi:RHS repeat-associated protein